MAKDPNTKPFLSDNITDNTYFCQEVPNGYAHWKGQPPEDAVQGADWANKRPQKAKYFGGNRTGE